MGIKGLSEAKIEKIIHVAKTIKSTGVFCTGREIMHMRSVIIRVWNLIYRKSSKSPQEVLI